MASMAVEPCAMGRDGFTNGENPAAGRVKRWDGAARSCSGWDNLRKDPDLWFRHGNCHVHLYGKGQSRRGPSFKIPFTDLLGARCHPLIQRFLVFDGPDAPNVEDLDGWNRANPRRVVELYIPPPPMADKAQSFHYHLATRNFFAFVFRRSVVGEHLGGALVGLLHSMHEFRAGTEDNVEDLMDYLDEEGYLNLAERPDHALAALQLAEFFRLRDLYVRAFAHCVGMSDRLIASCEYQHTSLVSKKLIRKSRQDLDSRLDKATDMLSTFMDDELSEAYLGIPTGARCHIESFRTFLLSFYSRQLGYYPPQSFNPEVFFAMRDDFQALYELLVDDAYAASEIMPSVAAGGICTLQLVQTFDEQHRYDPLGHPLPLLPQYTQRRFSRRFAWLPRRDRIKPEQRFLAHAALIKASNWRESIFKNGLVRAYRSFEEQSVVAPAKPDRQETLSLMDARKMRWLMVYATYQVLRSVTDAPPELRDECRAPYHTTVDTATLPPWRAANEPRDIRRQLRTQAELATLVEAPESPILGWHEPGLDATPRAEIRPDVDYFALTHREPPPKSERRRSVAVSQAGDGSSGPPLVPERSTSLQRALSRTTIRRSMRMFSPSPPQATTPQPAAPSYHEIVVHGYGNGTNDVNFGADATRRIAHDAERPNTATGVSRSDSTGSHSDASADSGPESMDSAADTAESSGSEPSPTTPHAEDGFDDAAAVKPLRPRPVSTIVEGSGASYSDAYTALVEEERANIFGSDATGANAAIAAPAPLRPKSRRRWSLAAGAVPRTPVRIRGGGSGADELEEERLEEEWAAMHAFMDDGREKQVAGADDDDVKPAWEQYADLGGLTEANMI